MGAIDITIRLLMATGLMMFLVIIGLMWNIMSIFMKSDTMTFNQRIKWYLFSRPPKICNVCGTELVCQGYDKRFYCKRCDKIICSIDIGM